jgi:hypothetical protein
VAFENVIVGYFRSAQLLPIRPCPRQAGLDAVLDHCALEFGEHAVGRRAKLTGYPRRRPMLFIVRRPFFLGFPPFLDFNGPYVRDESLEDDAHSSIVLKWPCLWHASKEIVMAKAKKRDAPRKRSSKRGKANAKPARKLAAKQATPKKAKSKVKRTAVSANKPAAKRKRSPEPVKTMQVAAMPVETTPIDVIDEPAPGVVAVTEHESAQ